MWCLFCFAQITCEYVGNIYTESLIDAMYLFYELCVVENLFVTMLVCTSEFMLFIGESTFCHIHFLCILMANIGFCLLTVGKAM